MNTNYEKICAVIISYNIGKKIYRCLNSIINQVDKILIVDNGSDEITIKTIKKIGGEFSNVAIILNKENLGIAAALSQAAEYAVNNNYYWLLTLDHDSAAKDKMIERMLNVYKNFPENFQQTVAILAPNYQTAKGLTYRNNKISILTTAITSGQLVKTSIFKKIGFYKNDLFIESVDNEFCLRAKKNKLRTILVPRAVLNQNIGDKPKLHNFFGKKFIIGNHAPIRYYYIYRNSIYLYKNFWGTDRQWILKNIFSNIELLGKIIIFEKEKYRKISMILKGIFHGFKNRYGEYSWKSPTTIHDLIVKTVLAIKGESLLQKFKIIKFWFKISFRKIRPDIKKEMLALKKYVPIDGVCIDVGANYGVYTYAISQLLCPNGKIYAFEPGQFAFSVLKNATRKFKPLKIQIFKYAIWNRSGKTMKLSIPVFKTGSMAYELGYLNKDKGENVTTITIDDFVEKHKIDKIDFIKMDIEGADLMALQGAKKSLKKYYPAILCEIQDHHTLKFGYTSKEIFKFLKGLGYKSFRIDSVNNIFYHKKEAK